MKKSERRLIAVSGGSIALLLSAGLWWTHLNAAPTIIFPTRRFPEPNAFDFYVKAARAHAALSAATPNADAVDRLTDPNGKPGLTPRQITLQYPTAAKVAWIKKNAPVLKTLRQGFRYKYMEPPQRSINATFPHYSQFRRIARLLATENHSRSEQGDWTGASRSMLDCLRLGHDVPRGGPIFAALVGHAINAISRRELQIITPHLDPMAARAAAARIEQLEARRTPFSETLREEKWIGQAYLKQTMSTRNWRPLLTVVSSNPPISLKNIGRYFFNSKHTIVRNHAHYMDALIAQAQRPYQRVKAPPVDPLSRFLMPSLDRARWNAARDETGNLMVMMQLALRAFQLECGHLPDALDELTPSYLKQVPRDPFGGGETLRYRKSKGTYLLYSIGPDGKDNGGKAITRMVTAGEAKLRHVMQPDSTGDYVAGINR